MKPPPFEYHDPTTLQEALQSLSEIPEAKVLAGGQSLIPMLNMRLVKPHALISLGRIADLNYIRDDSSHLAIGATTTYRQLQESPLVQAHCPLLLAAIPYIGNVAVRTRGSIGGSLSHADPTAELPAVAVALDATIVTAGPDGHRELGAAGFFVDSFAPALGRAELLAEVRLPKFGRATGVAVAEVASRRRGPAICGVVAQVRADGRRIAAARVGLMGAASTPIALDLQELRDSPPGPGAFDRAASLASDRATPVGDLRGTARWRRQLVGALTRRALASATEGAIGEGGRSP